MRALVRGSLLLALLLAQLATSEAQVAVPIRPTPGHQTNGQAAVEVTSAGDLVLQVAVQGPQEEISRSENGSFGQNPMWPNLIWHIVEGTCDAWIRETADRGKVLYRFIEVPNHPASLNFRTTISRAWLGQLDGRRLALAAFRNGGGGPLYTCADLPINLTVQASPPAPTPTDDRREWQGWGITAAGLVLLGSAVMAWRLARRVTRHRVSSADSRANPTE